MVASIDGDVAKISKIQEQLSDFAEKIELSKKAMKVITKIHHALCMSEKAAQSGAERGLEHR